MDGNPDRRNKAAFSNAGVILTAPKFVHTLSHFHLGQNYSFALCNGFLQESMKSNRINPLSPKVIPLKLF